MQSEALAIDVAHVDEEAAVDLAPVVDRDHVSVDEPGGDLGLALEPDPVLRIGTQFAAQQLERHDAFPPRVVCPVDLAHAAPAEQDLQPIRPEVLSRTGPCGNRVPRRRAGRPCADRQGQIGGGVLRCRGPPRVARQ